MVDIDRGSGGKLDAIAQSLGLSEIELASLLNVQIPLIDEWRLTGIPKDDVAKVERLLDLVGLLARELKLETIPEIVRTPEAWLGGRSIIDTLRCEGPEPVEAYLHRLFAYQASCD